MTRRADGTYQEAVMINGKRHFFYGHTKAEVLRKIRDYEVAQERGKLFNDVADEWWAETENTVAYNTTKGYKPALNRARTRFAGEPIKDITPKAIAAYIAEFARQGNADKTVRTQLMIFNLICRFAVEKGYIQFNPVRDLTVPKNLPKEKRTSPSPIDIQRVKNSTDCTFGMFAFWALYTGLRKGELLALEWKDVDLAKRTITVNKSLYHDGNKPLVKLPKTAASISAVPILDVLMAKIKPSTGLVFPNKDGGYISNTQFITLWNKYKAESKVTATVHQFRHAYATMLYEAGIPPEEAQALLRHAQIATTMDIYTDIREAKLKSIHDKVYKIDIV